MNLFNYKDVENYLKNKQVYFRKEIINTNLKTIAKSERVHDIGEVNLSRLNEDRIVFSLYINGIETTMYEYKSDLELFAWIKTNFIPVSKLVEKYNIGN